MKIRRTAVMVVIFLIAFTAGMYAERAKAGEHAVQVGLGTGVVNGLDWITQNVGYEYDERWYVQAMRTGNDDALPDLWRYTAGRRVHWRDGTGFEPYAKFGIAWFDNKPSALVDAHATFDLSVGFEVHDMLRLEWQHNSTAGRSDPNTGIDVVVLAFNWEF